MMKSKYRMLWMQAHTYVACFFLPITLLYVITGVLYLFDIKGEDQAKYTYQVSLSDGWPKDEVATKAVVLPLMVKYQQGKLPPDFYHEPTYIGWYGYKKQVFFDPSQGINNAKLTVIKHSLWQQLLLIHKGHAGIFFWFFAIMLGLSLVISAISGVVMALSMTKFRAPALYLTGLGFSLLIVMIIFGY